MNHQIIEEQAETLTVQNKVFGEQHRLGLKYTGEQVYITHYNEEGGYMPPIRHFWNYFIALENDLINISRYIELTEDNFPTYSIELEKLLFSACSEFEVISKELALLMTGSKPANIEKIHEFLSEHFHKIFSLEVKIERYGIKVRPFEDWSKEEKYTPLSWWKSYNDVKHHRMTHYAKANLNNVLNSLAALLVINFHYYQALISQEDGKPSSDLTEMEVITKMLSPRTQLLEVDSSLYYEPPYLWNY